MHNLQFDALICSHNGHKRLPEIVDSLLSQTLLPANIVICSTSHDDLINITSSQLTHIIHIVSPIANQVVQRLIGLTYCESQFIFQLDDDITLAPNCSEILFEFLNHNPHSIVAPLISVSKSSFVPQGINWLNACKYNIFTRFYLSLQGFSFSSPKSMSILRFGSVVPLIHMPDKPQKVDWLHSCRMYKKDSAYHISAMLAYGKSYFEDIYSAAEYLSLDYVLYLLPSAIAFHPPATAINSKEGISMLRLQFIALKKFNINKFMLSITMILTFFFRIFFSKWR